MNLFKKIEENSIIVMDYAFTKSDNIIAPVISIEKSSNSRLVTIHCMIGNTIVRLLGLYVDDTTKCMLLVDPDDKKHVGTFMLEVVEVFDKSCNDSA